MSLLTRILGHDEVVEAYDAHVTYCDGSTADVHVFATDMRDALKKSTYWIPLHMPASSVLVTERGMKK